MSTRPLFPADSMSSSILHNHTAERHSARQQLPVSSSSPAPIKRSDEDGNGRVTDNRDVKLGTGGGSPRRVVLVPSPRHRSAPETATDTSQKSKKNEELSNQRCEWFWRAVIARCSEHAGQFVPLTINIPMDWLFLMVHFLELDVSWDDVLRCCRRRAVDASVIAHDERHEERYGAGIPTTVTEQTFVEIANDIVLLHLDNVALLGGEGAVSVEASIRTHRRDPVVGVDRMETFVRDAFRRSQELSSLSAFLGDALNPRAAPRHFSQLLTVPVLDVLLLYRKRLHYLYQKLRTASVLGVTLTTVVQTMERLWGATLSEPSAAPSSSSSSSRPTGIAVTTKTSEIASKLYHGVWNRLATSATFTFRVFCEVVLMLTSVSDLHGQNSFPISNPVDRAVIMACMNELFGALLLPDGVAFGKIDRSVLSVLESREEQRAHTRQQQDLLLRQLYLYYAAVGDVCGGTPLTVGKLKRLLLDAKVSVASSLLITVLRRRQISHSDGPAAGGGRGAATPSRSSTPSTTSRPARPSTLEKQATERDAVEISFPLFRVILEDIALLAIPESSGDSTHSFGALMHRIASTSSMMTEVQRSIREPLAYPTPSSWRVAAERPVFQKWFRALTTPSNIERQSESRQRGVVASRQTPRAVVPLQEIAVALQKSGAIPALGTRADFTRAVRSLYLVEPTKEPQLVVVAHAVGEEGRLEALSAPQFLHAMALFVTCSRSHPAALTLDEGLNLLAGFLSNASTKQALQQAHLLSSQVHNVSRVAATHSVA